MKTKFHIIHSIIFYYIFFFLINTSYEKDDNYIEQQINIKDEKFPFISDGNKNFLISLSIPIIFIPENNIFENKYSYTTIFNDTFEFYINKKQFLLNEKMTKEYDYGSIINSNKYDYGFLGLARDTKGFGDLEKKTALLPQLLNDKIISKEIIYIEPYYKNNNIVSQSPKMVIGKFPKSLAQKRSELPFCTLKKKTSFFDCNLDGVLIENKNNKIYLYERNTSSENNFIVRFEEGSIQPIYIPKSLFKEFQNYFKNYSSCNCNENDYEIKCDSSVKDNITFSLVINNYKFILNPQYFWNDNIINIKFNRDDNVIILTSGFTGYYHRVYDNYNNKIYFFNENNKIISLKKTKSNDLIYWLSLLSASVLVLLIAIIIIICATSKRKKTIEENIKISFQKQRDEEEDNDNDLLV